MMTIGGGREREGVGARRGCAKKVSPVFSARDKVKAGRKKSAERALHQGVRELHQGQGQQSARPKPARAPRSAERAPYAKVQAASARGQQNARSPGQHEVKKRALEFGSHGVSRAYEGLVGLGLHGLKRG